MRKLHKMFLVCALAVAALGTARAQTLVTITDTLKYPNGTNWSGRIHVEWEAFTSPDAVTIIAGAFDYTVTNGAVSLSLVPNVGATPAETSYTVTYFPALRSDQPEYWVVPASGPVEINAIRTYDQPRRTVTVLPQQVVGGTADRCARFSSSGVLSAATSDCGAGGGSITTREVDASPSISSTSILEVDQADGLVLTNPSGTIARLDLSNLPDGAVADNITLTNITQITNRAVSDTTGDLAASRVDDGGVAATQALFSGAGAAAGFRAIADGDVPDNITITLAGTATALAANGANCSANNFAKGVDAGGAAEGCEQLAVASLSDAADVVKETQSNTYGAFRQSFESAVLGLPNGTAPPGTCTVSDLFFDNNAAAGARLALCTALNTFSFIDNPFGTAIDDSELASNYSGTGSCTNQAVTAVNDNAGPTCTTITSAYTSGTFAATAHNLLSSTHGDTAAGTVVLGDVIFGNSTPAWARLAGNTTATKNFLTQTGNGSVSAAPVWGTIAAGDLPSHNAATATALAANGANCSGNNFALGVDASGAAECAQPAFGNLSGSATDAQVPDTITASNYLPLAGGTLTGQLVTDNLGIEFEESDTNPSCSAGNYNLFVDLSEGKFKKCVNGSASDLDTTGGTPDFGTITGGTNTGAAMVVGSGASLRSAAGILGMPSSTSLPGTCTTGDVHHDNDAAVGSRYNLCNATNTWVAIDNPFGTAINNAEVDDDITLTNITQITNRAVSDTTGDLAASRVDDGGVAATQALFSGAGAAAGFRAIADGDIPAALARDSEINVQGTTNEITSSGSGVAPTLSLASSLDLGGKSLEVPNSTSLPGTCTVGQVYHDTDAAVGARWSICNATNTWVAIDNPFGTAINNAEVDDDITLTNITQITNRAVSDTTGDLAASRVDDGGVAATQALFSGAGSAAGFRAIADGDIPAAIARDSEINVQGTTNEITSSGSGVAPTLALAAAMDLGGKIVELPNGTTLTSGDCDAAGEAGRVFIDTDATSGQRFYVCEGVGGWVLQGDGGGGGGLADPGGNGVVVRTALNTTVNRTITGTANEISVADGNGLSANPTISLSATLDLGGKSLEVPNSTSLPGTCTVGQVYHDTDAAVGARWSICNATNTWVAIDNPFGTAINNAEVDDDITLTNITQITNRAVSDTTGDLAASRVDDGGVAATQALFSGAGSAAGFRAIADADVPDNITITTTPSGSVLGTGRTITSGNGLTGGGDLSADRTLAVGAGNGMTVNADDVALGGALTGGTTLTSDGTSETIIASFEAAYSTGQYFQIRQQTGNTTGGTLLDVRAADAQTTVFRAGDGTNGITVSQAGALTAEGSGSITATLGDSASSFFATGTIEAARLPAATTSAQGAIEIATAAEINTGTDATRAVSPGELADSTVFGMPYKTFQVFGSTTTVTTGDQKFVYPIPDEIVGMNIVQVQAWVFGASSSGAVNVDLALCRATATGDACSGTVSDVLSTNLTIDASESKSDTAAAAAVIDTANDDMQDGDYLRVDVDGAGTSVEGLWVKVRFAIP